MTFSSTIQNQYSTLHGLKLFKYTDLENCKWKIVRQCRFSEQLLLSQIYYFHCKSGINFFSDDLSLDTMGNINQTDGPIFLSITHLSITQLKCASQTEMLKL